MLAHHFSHRYHWRRRRMVPSVINSSCYDHTRLSVRFQPWNWCWGLCGEIDVGPPLFILLPMDMPMDGAKCDRLLVFWSHQTLCLVLAMELLLGVMLRNRCWPTTFHITTTGEVDKWCWNWPVWSTPHAPITPNTTSSSNHENVEE
jgi:hypothetical protein